MCERPHRADDLPTVPEWGPEHAMRAIEHFGSADETVAAMRRFVLMHEFRMRESGFAAVKPELLQQLKHEMERARGAGARRRPSLGGARMNGETMEAFDMPSAWTPEFVGGMCDRFGSVAPHLLGDVASAIHAYEHIEVGQVRWWRPFEARRRRRLHAEACARHEQRVDVALAVFRVRWGADE